MKNIRLLAAIFLVALPAFLYAGQISLNGVAYKVDTVDSYPVGPGTTYVRTLMTRVSDGAGRLDVYILQVDTRNPYISIEQELGKNKLVGTERPSAMAERITTPTHVAFAGTNGDFFVTSGDVGRPTGLTIENNEYAYIGSTARKVGAVKSNGKPIVGNTWKYTGRLYTAGNKDTLVIKHVNYTRNENELVLYNQLQGANTGTNAYGTELLVELCEGQQWKTHGRQTVVVKSKERNVGSMQIPAGQAVLSAHGTMQQALDSLVSVGDTLTVRYTLKIDGVNTNLSQAIGGDNYCLIVDSGRIPQEGFWNELHPRTGYGMSQTGDTAIFCVVDGRGQSVGCTTKVLGEIMKSFGAWRAVNWDGGGSSTMYVRQVAAQVNHGSDGSERAVGNAMFVVANLPEADEQLATLRPYYPVYALPYCGIYTPHFRGYNKYGVLIDNDVQGVRLSCDESVGEIRNNGLSFFASTRNGGTLTAEKDGAQTQIEIQIVAGDMRLRLDSVVLDKRQPWKVEVVNQSKDEVQQVEASALSWKSENEQVCTVSGEGVLTAGENGETRVTGTLGDFSCSLLVRVQTPAGKTVVADDFSETDTWKLTSMTGYNPQWTQTDGTPAVTFNYSITRKPYILLEKNVVLYGLPDTMKIRYGTDAVLESLNMVMKTAAYENKNKTITDIQSSDNAEIVVPISQIISDTEDKAHYPLTLTALRFYLSSSTTAGARYLKMRELVLCYSGMEVTYADALKQVSLQVYPNPVGDRLHVMGAAENADIVMYDAAGRVVLQDRLHNGTEISLQQLSAGVYYLIVGEETVKILKY